MNEFYVYLHRRESEGPEGTPFYVGKGRNKRAYEKHGRNPHWKNIVAKHGLVVEIIECNLEEDVAFELEKKLILKYGKESLCNMTDGGDGVSGYRFESAIKNKIELLEYVKNNEEPPTCKSKVGRWYCDYVRNSSSDGHDATLTEEVYSIRPDWRGGRRRDASESQALVRKFIEKSGYIPNQTSKNPEEKRLGVYCSTLQSVNSRQFDQEFSYYLKTKVKFSTFCSNKSKELVKKFCLDNQRVPNKASKDKEEKKLGMSLVGYYSPSNETYDPEFRQWAINNGFLKPKTKENCNAC